MNKIFYLDINRVCNNNCIGCALDPFTIIVPQKTSKEIEKQLDEGIKQGYKIFHPIGGETTLHPDLPKILSKAKTKYKKIALTSNGRLFFYQSYVKKFKDLPIMFNITLCGPNKKIHEAWTRTQGSFKQTLGGIKNLANYHKKICLNLILWKRANDSLHHYVKLIKILKPDDLGILALGPFGRCKDKFQYLSPSLTELTKLNPFLKKIKSYVKDIDIEDFPLCIFQKKVLQTKNFYFQDISSSIYIGNDGRIQTLGLFAANEQHYPINSFKLNQCDLKILKNKISTYKIKLAPCLNCELGKKCAGIYKEYVNWKGKKFVEKEIIQLKRFNKVGQYSI